MLTKKEIITLGKSNLNGELVPAPFDEKNLLTDWLEDFLFDGNVSVSKDNHICGYVDLEDLDMLCELSYTGYTLKYEFVCHNRIGKRDVDILIERLREYLADCDNMTVMAYYDMLDENFCRPRVSFACYARCEE